MGGIPGKVKEEKEERKRVFENGKELAKAYCQSAQQDTAKEGCFSEIDEEAFYDPALLDALTGFFSIDPNLSIDQKRKNWKNSDQYHSVDQKQALH